MKKAYVAPDAEFVTLIANEDVTLKGDLDPQAVEGSMDVEDW